MPEEQDAKTKKPAVKKTAEKKVPADKAAARKPTEKNAPAKKAASRKPPEEKAAGAIPAEERPPKPTPAPDKPAKKRPAATSPAPEPADETAAPKQPEDANPTAEKLVAENPLHKKLGLRPEALGVVIAPPEDDNPLLPLPEGLSVLAGIDELAALDGPFDYMHVFARDRVELAGACAGLRDKLASGGSLWISWMKQSSGRRRGEMSGDLNENIIRRIALTNGMVDVKVATLDRDWSALRLVHRKH